MSNADLEEGEILSDEENAAKSDTFEAYSLIERPERSKFVASGGYRNGASQVTKYSSDEESSCDSSEGDTPRKKQRMGFVPGKQNTRKGGYKQDHEWLTKAHKNIQSNAAQGKKMNNVWASVLEEENMSSCVDKLNRNEKISYERGAESYDYTRSSLDPRLENQYESSETSSEESETEGAADLTVKETFGFDIDKKPNIKSRLGHRKSSSEVSSYSRSRSVSLEKGEDGMDSDDGSSKTPVQNRHKYRKSREKDLSKNVEMEVESNFDEKKKIKTDKGDKKDTVDLRQKIKGKDRSKKTEGSDSHCRESRKRTCQDRGKQNLRKNQWNSETDKVELKQMKFSVKVDVDMEDMELADTIIDALREPPDKMDLFLRIIDQIGAEKTIKIFKATEDIEEMGGLMIQNGSRRRTPGGVFLYLIRQDCDVSEEQQDIMFGPERVVYHEKLKAQKKERRAKKKELRRKSEENPNDKVVEGSMDTDEHNINSNNVENTKSDKVLGKGQDLDLQEDHEAINIELS